jgi:hypothetical protein
MSAPRGLPQVWPAPAAPPLSTVQAGVPAAHGPPPPLPPPPTQPLPTAAPRGRSQRGAHLRGEWQTLEARAVSPVHQLGHADKSRSAARHFDRAREGSRLQRQESSATHTSCLRTLRALTLSHTGCPRPRHGARAALKGGMEHITAVQTRGELRAPPWRCWGRGGGAEAVRSARHTRRNGLSAESNPKSSISPSRTCARHCGHWPVGSSRSRRRRAWTHHEGRSRSLEYKPTHR